MTILSTPPLPHFDSVPIFTYGISVRGVASYDKYLSKIEKFQQRTVRFGFLVFCILFFTPSYNTLVVQ